MAVNSRESLKQYALRALGAPVVEINVDDDQLEDRLDEAIDYWRLYHYDGIEEMYMKQQIRASEMTLTTNNAASFNLGDIVTGLSSGAKATVTKDHRTSSGNLLLVRDVKGTFQGGEVLAGTTITATLDTNTPITLREYDNKYINIPDHGIVTGKQIGRASCRERV